MGPMSPSTIVPGKKAYCLFGCVSVCLCYWVRLGHRKCPVIWLLNKHAEVHPPPAPPFPPTTTPPFSVDDLLP